MTIVRMRLIHGLEISAADQAALVAYLADTQGLAPSETEGYRYALEKDPNVVEAFDEPFRSMCARCHTGARVLLQRRTPEEWATHIEFHVGQFPTVEYQALGRDRDWYQVARDEMAPMLAELHPLESEAWTAWSAAEKPAVAGDWVVLTDLPGKGAAYGRLTVEGDASPYTVSGEMRLADGTALPVSGSMNLYTGYEWRANLTVGRPGRPPGTGGVRGRRAARRAAVPARPRQPRRPADRRARRRPANGARRRARGGGRHQRAGADRRRRARRPDGRGRGGGGTRRQRLRRRRHADRRRGRGRDAGGRRDQRAASPSTPPPTG